MRQIVIYVAVAIVIFCIIVEKRMIDHRRKQIEFDYISWIEVGGLYSPRCGSLFDYICTAQKEMEIPVQYCVLAKDEENVRLIIKKFQQDISTRFFARNLSLGKPNHKIKAKDMFFYLLFMYLEEHECVVPEDRGERNDLMDQIDEAKFDEIDRRVWEGNIEKFCYMYLTENRASFETSLDS